MKNILKTILLCGTIIVVTSCTDLEEVLVVSNDRTITLPTNSLTISGATSINVETLSWSQVSGPNTSSIVNDSMLRPSFRNLIEGTYVFRLTGTNNNSVVATDNMTVTVNPAVVNRTRIYLIVSTGCSDAARTDNITNGYIEGSLANLVLGAFVYSANTGNSLLSSGGFLASESSAISPNTINRRLIISNGRVVSSSECSGHNSSVNAGRDLTITLPVVNSVSLAGATGTNIDTYSWSQVSGPSTASIINSTSLRVSFRNLIEGTYVFRLTGTTNNTVVDTDSMTVIVNPGIPDRTRIYLIVSTGCSDAARTDNITNGYIEGSLANLVFGAFVYSANTGNSLLSSGGFLASESSAISPNTINRRLIISNGRVVSISSCEL